MKKSPASIEDSANASAQQTRADSANAAEIIFHSKPTENQATKENTMKATRRIRTRAGAIRRYNAILSRHLRETAYPHTSGMFDQSWDWPTLRICYPTTARKLEIVCRIFELLKS